MVASDDSIRLSAGVLRLVLRPSVGGSIFAFEYEANAPSVNLLRKCNSSEKNVLEMGSFPLVPYVNRIRGARFEFRGRSVALAPNMAGDPSPLHGQGWLGEWTVQTVDSRSAVLGFAYSAGEWPWDYSATQHFELDEQGLSLRLTCRNESQEAMPCGLGQHPYFPCGPETRLDTSVSHAWTIDEQVLPVERVPAAGEFDLSNRLVCGQGLDHGFGGWSGSARMTDPDWPIDLELSSPNADFFQLYSPVDGGIFVAEPVTHANAALNAPEEQWQELGMHILEPGEEMHLDMRLEVRPK